VPQTRVRVGGSGFTTITYQGKPIAFLTRFQDGGVRPQGGGPGGVGYEAITVLGDSHPSEIATSRVLGPGLCSFFVKELWNAPVWYQLPALSGANDIVDVFARLAAQPTAVTVQMLIKPPGSPTWRGKTYHNVVLFDLDDGEDITVGALSIDRQLQAAYTHTTRFTTPARG
jgi:hypothetical protein